MSSFDTQTRDLLFGFLDEPDSLDDVRRRFMGLAWRLDSDEAVAANPLTAQASLWLAEYGAGHWKASDLQKLVAGLLGSVDISYAPDRSVQRTGATAILSGPSPKLVGVDS